MSSPYTPPEQQPSLPPEAQPGQQDATGGVIPYKNVPSLVGYYLGIFSLIPILGTILGPAALVCGIIGFRNYLKDKRKRGHIHAWVAIILGALITFGHLVLIYLVLVAAR